MIANSTNEAFEVWFARVFGNVKAKTELPSMYQTMKDVAYAAFIAGINYAASQS